MSMVLKPRHYIRRLFHIVRGQDFWQGIQMRCKRCYLGNEGANWCISPDGLADSSIVYSFGVGEDVSFDLEMIRRFQVELHAFDPTPKAVDWVRRQSLPTRFVFHEYGIAPFDGSCKFQPPQNPAHISHTMLERGTTWPSIDLPVRRLSTIMESLGHERIDLIKMDIEGAEYGVLSDLLSSDLRVGQLLVEFHHRWPEVGIEKTKKAVRDLNIAGFRIFDVSSTGDEYSFRHAGTK